MGPFCIDDISDIVFSPRQLGMTPPRTSRFFLSNVSFALKYSRTGDLNLHFYALQIHKSSTLRVFLSMLLYRDMQYLQKKEKKDDYNLKINVPKVTMLCK